MSKAEPRSRAVSASRTHVLAVVDSWSGGAETFARRSLIGLDPARYRRTMCITRPDDDRPSDVERAARAELEAAEVPVLQLDRRGTADLLAWRPLVRFLRDAPVHVMHAHKFGSNVWAAVLRTPGRVPVCIAHEHTWSYEGQPVRKALDRHLIARRCERIVAVSRADRDRMIEIERIPAEKIEVLPIGISPRQPSGHDVRSELGIAREDPTVVCVGYLRAQKAHEVLVEATTTLRRTHPQVRVLIVGNGPRRPALEELIATRGLKENVRLLGTRNDIPDLVAAADVAVSCSDFEGSPLAVIEYMALGKPVVATRVGGVPDLVEDGRTGLLVPPRDPHELAQALLTVLDDPARGREMGAAGRERQRAELTLDAAVVRLDDLYTRLLRERA